MRHDRSNRCIGGRTPAHIHQGNLTLHIEADALTGLFMALQSRAFWPRIILSVHGSVQGSDAPADSSYWSGATAAQLRRSALELAELQVE